MSTNLYRQLLIRRDTLSNIPVLAEGEMFFTTDSREMFVGTSTGNLKINHDYDPANAADWQAPVPTTIIEAIDRMASAVSGLLGGMIP